MGYRYFTLIFIVVFTACSKNKKQEEPDDTDRMQVLYTTMAYSKVDSSDTKLRLSIDYDFGNSIILGDNSVEGIQSMHNNQFAIDSIRVGDSVDRYVLKLTCDSSYIKIYHNNYGGTVPGMLYDMSSDDLVCAVIVDESVKMQNGIHIGMSKTDFFTKILDTSISNGIDTIHTGDEEGDIEHQFIFKDDKLNRVLITSTYKFADFSFHEKPNISLIK